MKVTSAGGGPPNEPVHAWLPAGGRLVPHHGAHRRAGGVGTAPESALLVLRFATAGIVLGVVFARRRPLAGVSDRAVWPRLLLMAAVDAFTLLLFFVAIRDTSVAVGMFLQFLAPVRVALIAPRVFRARTEFIVYPALAIALAGLAVILAPSLLGEGIRLSPWGVAAGLLAGVGYAVFQLVVKDLTNRRLFAVTIVFTDLAQRALPAASRAGRPWGTATS